MLLRFEEHHRPNDHQAKDRHGQHSRNDDGAKKKVTDILTAFGFETEDMGKAEAARAIEPLSILWCIPGFIRNQWTHAFKLLKM